jgi:hypothetical protein
LLKSIGRSLSADETNPVSQVTGVIVYIWGNLTADNFTPRFGKHTMGGQGQQPGLSASNVIPPGRKAQGIDIDKLKPPLKAIADDVSKGGMAGHFAIAPVRENGEVDVERLEAWARTRGTGQPDELTTQLLDAVVEPNAKGSKP